MNLALLQKDHIGQAAAEKYLDLCLHCIEKICEHSNMTVENLGTFHTYCRLKKIRNKLTHRYSDFLEEQVGEELDKCYSDITTIATELAALDL